MKFTGIWTITLGIIGTRWDEATKNIFKIVAFIMHTGEHEGI